jgi:hypothetical protein
MSTILPDLPITRGFLFTHVEWAEHSGHIRRLSQAFEFVAFPLLTLRIRGLWLYSVNVLRAFQSPLGSKRLASFNAGT